MFYIDSVEFITSLNKSVIKKVTSLKQLHHVTKQNVMKFWLVTMEKSYDSVNSVLVYVLDRRLIEWCVSSILISEEYNLNTTLFFFSYANEWFNHCWNF